MISSATNMNFEEWSIVHIENQKIPEFKGVIRDEWFLNFDEFNLSITVYKPYMAM